MPRAPGAWPPWRGRRRSGVAERRARLALALVRACARLPLPLAHALGAALGWLLARVPNRTRRVAAINLARCFPELSPAARRRLLRRSLVEAGKTLTEVGALWTWPREALAPLVREIRGREAVDAALAAGRGVILATPHLGSWEMAGHVCGMEWGITSLYRPPRLQGVEAFMKAGREHLGARLVRTDRRGVRILYERLRAGGVVGILPDQEPGPEGGVFAPFFGHPAWTMVLLPRLARRTGAAVFVGYCERLPRARGYRLHIHPVDAAAIRDADPGTAAAALNRAVEACVRACPEQYQWGYRRFRTRPPGEPPWY
ncbi:MAG: lipid A biosynthesis acyltransferase [Gammaproteobacteria bacterium]|nr:MAG: lipid A biosynthesis acyltransferase [Gammaproteobacteria bacterium]